MITPKELLALSVKWLVISVVVLFCTVWLVDELSFQHKTHTSSAAAAYGTVYMQHMLAIEKKGGKVEYAMDPSKPPEVEPCVNSLFPHAGLTPCWYLQRQNRQPVLLVILSVPSRYFDLRTLALRRF
jgi:hypothetical protein